MKLELKHLVGYLPYGLKYECNGVTYYYQHCSTRDFDYENSKPILRPLSNITKFCEDLGFVPIEIIESISENIGIDFYDYAVENLPYSIIQKLYEWHFDIHGLIENNLAIDKNTLL